jgi:hypothetical protein
MTQRVRKYLFLLFLLIFLIATPLVCLYAAGYKFNSSFKIQRTGAFNINTKPTNAKIILNDKPQQDFFEKYFFLNQGYITTPAKLKNVLPGEYIIKLEKDGYWPWQKKLTVEPGQTTFIEHVSLFKKDLPLLLAEGNIKNFSLSPNKKMLAAISDKEVLLAKPDSEEQLSYAFGTTTISANNYNISWSSNQEMVLIDNWIFSVADWQTPIILNKILNETVKNTKWAVGGDNNLLYFSTGKTLNVYDLTTKKETVIIDNGNIIDFMIKENTVYYINREGKFLKLVISRINDKNLINQVDFPDSDYTFINQDHDLINLLDQKNKILFLINPQNNIQTIRQTLNNVNYAKWIDNTKLLFANDFEVWIFDLDSRNNKLLTRISTPIKSVIPYPNDNYVLFSTEQTINTIELDDREKYNITEIVKLEKINNPQLNKKGDILYFFAQIGKQEGIYKLAIE